MSYAAEFLIEDGILKEYYGAGGEIEIPEGVSEIAPFAFCYCEMDVVFLPKSLVRLKKDAFRRCRTLGVIRFSGKTLKFGKDVFSYAPELPFFAAPFLPLGDVPPEVKPSCCCGFARFEEDFGKTATAQYLKYIQRQRKSLYPAALIHEELLRLMLREKFVTNDEAEFLLSSLSECGKTELSAEILSYQAANFKPRDPIKEMLREANRDPYSTSEMRKLWDFEKREDKTVLIRAYKGNEETVAVPPRIGKNVVTALSDFCFQFSNRPKPERGFHLQPFRQIYLPETVETIGKRAFDGCDELEKVNIPPNVSNLPAGIFEDCAALTEIKLPKGLLSIGSRAFLRCKSLAEIVIPKQVRTVESYAFNSCRGLLSVTFCGGTETVSTEAFSDCTSLSTVTLCEGTKRLGYGAFGCCEELRDIFLPESLEEIGRDAFYGCKLLTIHAPLGSFAEQYAKEHRIAFKEMEREALE